MQSNATTPEQFLESLPDDWRSEALGQLRSLLMDAAPELAESMNYKMLGYALGDDFMVHLNAQKNYVSLYVGDAAAIDSDGDLLDGLDVGKGCIRFKKSTPVGDSRIDEFIARAVDVWRSGAEPGC